MSPEDQKPRVASVVWAVAPLFTCGFAAPFTVGYAAAKLRSGLIAASVVLYAACLVFWLATDFSKGDDATPLDAAILLAMAASMFGATIQSVALRERVFGARPKSANQAALDLVQHRRELRRQARELARSDLSLAQELRIGRPDLSRQYDDGGLVDMNHAPKAAIAQLPGMTSRLAEQVVQARATLGEFVSAEDVLAAASLPPDLIEELTEYTIYLS